MNVSTPASDARADRLGVPPDTPPAEESTARLTPERLLQRLDWKVIRRLDGLLQGDYRSLFYGYGVDFADLREYQPEDDIRYIDWNVTARMDTPYVRQFIEDREITAWFLLDLSPSVNFGTAASLKREVMVDVSSTLARLLTRHGNRVGAIGYDSHATRTIPARGGRNQVLRLINELQQVGSSARAPLTNLTPLIENALHAVKQRSLIFLLSDFIVAPGWEHPLALLNRRHEVLAIHLWDPTEMELPDVGLIVMEDAETGEQMMIDTHDRRFRRRFAEVTRQRQIDRERAFAQAGVDVFSLSTEEDMVRAIVQFAARRKRRRK